MTWQGRSGRFDASLRSGTAGSARSRHTCWPARRAPQHALAVPITASVFRRGDTDARESPRGSQPPAFGTATTVGDTAVAAAILSPASAARLGVVAVPAFPRGIPPLGPTRRAPVRADRSIALGPPILADCGL